MLAVTYRKALRGVEPLVARVRVLQSHAGCNPYRDHTDRLFKRDFTGEMLDMFSDLELVDYGFVYRRDPIFPQDDITWFLLEKNVGRR